MLVKISPELAGRVMHKDAQFVRIGLQRGLLPFGKALQTRQPSGTYDRGHWSYYISPKLFLDFTGATEDEVREIAERIGEAV